MQRLNTDEETLGLIVKALKQPLGYDLRSGKEHCPITLINLFCFVYNSDSIQRKVCKTLGGQNPMLIYKKVAL